MPLRKLFVRAKDSLEDEGRREVFPPAGDPDEPRLCLGWSDSARGDIVEFLNQGLSEREMHDLAEFIKRV